MPDLDDIFPSKYLKVADLKGQSRNVAIVGAEAAVIGQGAQAAQKLVLRLSTPEGVPISKMLVVNKTNANQLAHDFGTRRTDSWVGKRMTLLPDTTSFQGQIVPCIRVRGAAEQAAPAAAPFPPGADNLDDVKW